MGHVYRVLAEQTISPSPEYFPERLIVEDCENIHIHYRNLRIELGVREFIRFVEVMSSALDEFRTFGGKVRKLKIDDVDPYDSFHPKGFENTDAQHRDGIEKVKRLIKAGKTILPILVRVPIDKQKLYKRQDGFKRYFAFKELGYKEINCFIVENRQLGGQEGMPWVWEWATK